ncbi:hypothetical protein [uncultured Pseudokineococcus sp.]|uniref:hypothetical protein n=1 Tax=uncultured Pseudokineococcus sp. TaxID=1642928 RepID=UPI0026102BB3|nr:hypothetical protein [uncultured Pseudokineococcus sp.]
MTGTTRAAHAVPDRDAARAAALHPEPGARRELRPRRALRAPAALLAAGALALAGCSGGSDGGSSDGGSAAATSAPSPSATSTSSSGAAAAVARALAAGQEAGSGSFDFSSRTSAGGQVVTATGQGAFDSAAQTLEVRLTSQLPGQGEVALDLRQVDGSVYVSGLPGQPPDRWVQASLPELGASSGPLGGADPSQQLRLLEQAGDDVEEVGPEDVDGTATTHYTGTVDLEAAAERAQQEGADPEQLRSQYEQLGLSSVPFDLYVGPDGLPVRMATSVETSSGGQQVSSTSTVDFSDWGADVVVEAPEDAVPLSEIAASAAPTG